jgi:hypothetical protein
MLYVRKEDDEEAVVISDEREGWYVRVDDDLDVFASGPGERQSNGEPGGNEWRCTTCGAEADDPSDFEEPCHADEHEWQPIPLSWANSAHLTFDDDNDQILVSISVGDPRGRFVMRVERVQWEEATEEGRKWRSSLRLAVPTDQDTMPHMDLKPLASPGYYEITNHSATY